MSHFQNVVKIISILQYNYHKLPDTANTAMIKRARLNFMFPTMQLLIAIHSFMPNSGHPQRRQSPQVSYDYWFTAVFQILRNGCIPRISDSSDCKNGRLPIARKHISRKCTCGTLIEWGFTHIHYLQITRVGYFSIKWTRTTSSKRTKSSRNLIR